MFKNLVYLGILTTFVVFSMVGFNIYHSYTTSTISQDTSEAITPIPSSFNKGSLDNLRQRKSVSVDFKNITPKPTVRKVVEEELNATSSAGSSGEEKGL